MRKLDRASLVRDFNLFPEPPNLLTLERKYGDSLNHEDIYGFKQKKKRRARNQAATTTQGDGATEVALSEMKSEA